MLHPRGSELRSMGWRSTENQKGDEVWTSLAKSSHKVPTALLVTMQRSRKDLYNAVEGSSTRPIVLSMITGSYFRRWMRLTIFEAKFAASLTGLVCTRDHRRRPGDLEIPSETYSRTNISTNWDKSSEYYLKNFPNFFLSLSFLSRQ